MRFRRKPTVFDAYQYLGPERILDGNPLPDAPKGVRFMGSGIGKTQVPYVETARHELMILKPGDWVVEEADGRRSMSSEELFSIAEPVNTFSPQENVRAH